MSGGESTTAEMGGQPAIRGLYWAARSYAGPSRRGQWSTPTERLTFNLMVLNHLLSAQRVRPEDVTRIPHPGFRSLIEAIGDRLFTPGTGCALYRSPLPPEACTSIRDVLPARRHPLTGEVRRFRSRMRHEVLFQPEWVYHTPTSIHDTDLLNRINCLNAAQIVEAEPWGDALPQGAALSAAMRRLIADGVLTPCDATNLSVTTDHDPGARHQYVYGELMGGVLPPQRDERRPLIHKDSPLYWVDLLQLSFKHGSIVNEGDINRALGTGYALTDNILRVIADPDFFTTLMRSARGEDNQVFILPLTLFVMNGRLYSHDHKRAAASLLGGTRYMLGALNQDGWLTQLREVGYHPTKGLFSRLDQGMLLYLTEAQMTAWGHWFFRVGGEDHTGLLRYIDAQQGSALEGDWLSAAVSDDPDFAALHAQVRPGVLATLDDPERLRRSYLDMLDHAAAWVQFVREQTLGDLSRGRLRKMLIGGYILDHSTADAVLDGRPGAVLDALDPYAAFIDAQRRCVQGLSGRDALLRWELTHIGNPLVSVVRQPWFSPSLRETVARQLPVLESFMQGEEP